MPKAGILAAYIIIDLLIGAGVVWCVLRGMPVGKYFIPAAVLFVLNGVWLVLMTVKKTPPGNG